MTFQDLNLNTPLLNALSDLNIQEPTRIQEKVFSVAMSGKDVVGIAQTGTGKTFAYLLPCLRRWKYQKNTTIQFLVVVPTRELVEQVVGEIEKLTTYMNVKVAGVYGGVNIRTQKAIVHAGIDVLVATPGRLLDLQLDGMLKVKNVKTLIIDEIDEMLDLGFRPQLKNILDILPGSQQNLLFSATLSDEVDSLIKTFFQAPVKIEAQSPGTPIDKIVQYAYEIPNFYSKVNLLHTLLDENEDMNKVLIFNGSRKIADLLYEEIQGKYEDQIGIIHSNKSQNYRLNAVRNFHSGEYRLLLATDLISRGIDISDVSHVINFDLPTEPTNYIHRVGRTGRADKEGTAISFITEKDDNKLLDIENMMERRLEIKSIPEQVELSELEAPHEMAHIKMPEVKVKKVLREGAGEAFHEKKAKNQKENAKVRHADLMKIKYKRPKTRGQKPTKKKR